jgi:hypothetical protein
MSDQLVAEAAKLYRAKTMQQPNNYALSGIQKCDPSIETTTQRNVITL